MVTSQMRRHVLFLASLALLIGCAPKAAASRDADKAVLYVHLMAADMAMLADDSFQAGDFWQDLDVDLKEMRAAARALPAGDPRAEKVAALVEASGRTVASFEKAMPEVAAAQAASRGFSARTPQLLALWDEVIRGMGESGSSVSQVMIANREVVLLDRMSRRANEVMGGDERGITAADAFQRDLGVYAAVLEGLQSGNPDIGLRRVASPDSQAALAKLKALQVDHAADAQAVLERKQAVQEARQSAERLRSIRVELMNAAAPAY
jgi:hypothetical protein